MNWIRRIMNKLFIDNESFDIDEDDITMSQIKNRIYVNGKLISEVNNDSVHISFTGNVKELNCNTCDIDGNALTVHGNSVKVKGNVGGSIEHLRPKEQVVPTQVTKRRLKLIRL